MSLTGIPELRDVYRTLGAARFALLMGGVLGYIGVFVWLIETVPGWPEAYGSTCHGRGCQLDYLWHSPGLLSRGWREFALFGFIWSTPAGIVGAFAYAIFRRLTRRDPLSTKILPE